MATSPEGSRFAAHRGNALAEGGRRLKGRGLSVGAGEKAGAGMVGRGWIIAVCATGLLLVECGEKARMRHRGLRARR